MVWTCTHIRLIIKHIVWIQKKIAQVGDQTQDLSIFIFKNFTAEPQQFVSKFIQINFQF
jgi:hypothetical protein